MKAVQGKFAKVSLQYLAAQGFFAQVSLLYLAAQGTFAQASLLYLADRAVLHRHFCCTLLRSHRHKFARGCPLTQQARDPMAYLRYRSGGKVHMLPELLGLSFAEVALVDLMAYGCLHPFCICLSFI